MIILNFAHPHTDEQRAQVEALTGQAIARVVAVPTQIDNAAPLPPQVTALVAACGLDAHEWQTLDLVVNPPGLAPVAVALVAEIHGRRGGFPALIRVRPVASAVGTRFEVAEVVNVQAIREAARVRRWE